MPRVEVHHAVGSELRRAVQHLLDDTRAATGRQPLSDHLALDLARGGSAGFVAAIAVDSPGETTDTPGAGVVVGYAQASSANEAYALELVLSPSIADSTDRIGEDLLTAVLDAIADRGGGLVNWLVFGPDPVHEELARRLGMTPSRTLLQMQRSLPTGRAATIETRPFVLGADDAQWLEVNNRAFAGHGEQGGWTLESLRQRQREDWFDPRDVLIHERDGRIVAFCWTKVHPATADRDRVGEIYIIAVHPDAHGRGLGRQMTLAGLDHLASSGITTGMLWVDADNEPARNLYDHLGFDVAATTVVYTIEVPAR